MSPKRDPVQRNPVATSWKYYRKRPMKEMVIKRIHVKFSTNTFWNNGKFPVLIKEAYGYGNLL